MPTAALTALEQIDATPDMSPAQRADLVTQVPAWQWAVPGGHWPELALHCLNRVVPERTRRPVNGLNIEIGAAQPRCLFRPPHPHGGNLAWFLSGGSVLDYGVCEQYACYRAQRSATEIPQAST